MESEAAIVIEDLTVAYDVKPVLWDIDLEIQAGTLTAVIIERFSQDLVGTLV